MPISRTWHVPEQERGSVEKVSDDPQSIETVATSQSLLAFMVLGSLSSASMVRLGLCKGSQNRRIQGTCSAFRRYPRIGQFSSTRSSYVSYPIVSCKTKLTNVIDPKMVVWQRRVTKWNRSDSVFSCIWKYSPNMIWEHVKSRLLGIYTYIVVLCI